MSAPERGMITEQRIRLITAREGETIEAAAARAHSKWRSEEISVVNGLRPGAQVHEGQVLKVAVEERYVTPGIRRTQEP